MRVSVRRFAEVIQFVEKQLFTAVCNLHVQVFCRQGMNGDAVTLQIITIPGVGFFYDVVDCKLKSTESQRSSKHKVPRGPVTFI